MRFVALWLSGICVAVFSLQQIFSTEPFVLINDLKWIEPWRLVTSIFAHSNAAHLLSNLFGLALFGLILEGRIGPKKVLWIFFVTGILVNVFSPFDRSLGASGAVYGILGTLAVLRPMMIIYVYWIPMPMFIAAIFWFMQDVFGVFYPTNVANIGHITGLAIGLGVGFNLKSKFGDRYKKPVNNKNPILEKQLDAWEEQYMKQR